MTEKDKDRERPSQLPADRPDPDKPERPSHLPIDPPEPERPGDRPRPTPKTDRSAEPLRPDQVTSASAPSPQAVAVVNRARPTLLDDPEQQALEDRRAQFGHVHGVTRPVEPSGDWVEVDTDAHAKLEGRAPIKVRAKRLIYYGDIRRRTGDVFTIYGEEAFSAKSMERVDPHTPERTTTGKQALKQEHDALRGQRSSGDTNVLTR